VRADEGYIYRLCGCGWREEDNLPDGLSAVLGSREIWGPGCSGKSETRKQRLGIGLVELSMGCRYWSRTLTPLTFMLSSPYILWGLNCIDGWMALMMADCSPFPHGPSKSHTNINQITTPTTSPRLKRPACRYFVVLFCGGICYSTRASLCITATFLSIQHHYPTKQFAESKRLRRQCFPLRHEDVSLLVFLLSVWVFFLTWSTVNKKRSPRKIPRFLILLFYPLFTFVPEQLVLKWL